MSSSLTLICLWEAQIRGMHVLHHIQLQCSCVSAEVRMPWTDNTLHYPRTKRVTLWPLTTPQQSQTLPQFRLVSQFCSHHQCLSHAGAQPGILHSWHSLLPLLLSQMHQGHSRRLFDFITGTGTELGTRFHLQK